MSAFLTSALILVLVTGIQPTRVCATDESFQPKDLGLLDSCDKHRNEGREDRRQWSESLHVLCQNQPSQRVS
ncbi:exported hypothetical protein [Agrobacterium deltaense Zutra 3/1]|uniref:Uncharacterized protein n=1 Tax=Agrobacterium deltaense Zutra 3/1 TaxID=1183427 RepID=A0A1S7PYS8_9HYPH|nr:exported hypothetical protein [Agrobacterium deltaense Zutra 3/1]